ncbi:hypothetical protein DPMN_098198 [Dreissena polymorpha]|uniref:Uncharacterized protein n=1 Tax=Dreissena polymorpha TaxID=45954 RepID=A0A9D4R634_DREPO|nr:hypothetical protein DPMN_098198 [Dreissena polymorpha]
MLENEQGKVRTATDRRYVVRSATNRYDQTTNPQRFGTTKYDAMRISLFLLRIRYGLVRVSTNKNGPLRSRVNCDELVQTGRNELRLNIAPTASCIVIHRMPPKKTTCKRQQHRVT